MKTLSTLLFSVFALLLFGADQASAAKLDTPWSGSGTSAVTLKSNGTTADPRLEWSADGATSGNWTFQVVAGSTRSVPVQWEASGFFGFFHVNLKLERFVTRGGTDVLREVLQQPAQTDCCDPPSGGFGYIGTSTFNVQAGDVYGLKITGSHQTGGPIMSGVLAIHEVDASAPLVTPVVTGTQAQGGYYAGPVSVKWTVQEDDSRITAQTGCGDATVTEDTAGKTFTCSVTSKGGTTAKSVTIKRDTGAPVLTVPTVVVKPAEAANGATVTFDASATDAVDLSPVLACAPASGARFAAGSTTNVSCTATDAAGNASTKTFDVIVLPYVAPPPPVVVVASTPTVLPQKISAVLSFRFTLTKKTTKLAGLTIKGIPARSTVVVTCSGGSCPKKLKGKGVTLTSKGTTLSLAALVKTALKSGTTITVTTSSPGSITSVKSLVIRKGKPPVVKTACKPAGAAKPVAC